MAKVVASVCVLLMTGSGSSGVFAAAPDYPTRPIRLIARTGATAD